MFFSWCIYDLARSQLIMLGQCFVYTLLKPTGRVHSLELPANHWRSDCTKHFNVYSNVDYRAKIEYFVTQNMESVVGQD